MSPRLGSWGCQSPTEANRQPNPGRPALYWLPTDRHAPARSLLPPATLAGSAPLVHPATPGWPPPRAQATVDAGNGKPTWATADRVHRQPARKQCLRAVLPALSTTHWLTPH